MMKNPGVCTGCKYRCTRRNFMLYGSCDYIGFTNESRIVKEMQNGGIKKDSCICYAPKEKKVRRNDL